MVDDTEGLRLAMILNNQPESDLENATERWTAEELARDFEVLGFSAPFVVVRRKSDGQKGSLEFTHLPRVYFDFHPYKGENND
jgi:hypothetical protein